MKAELGVYYTLEEFRETEMPDKENSLLFRLNNQTVDCDIGDLEVSKFRPVKIKVEDPEDPEDPVWAESDGKLQLFCAETLKRYVCTKVMYYYRRLQSKNPFDNREIRGVQYLTQDEIDIEVAKYSEGEDEVKILNVRLVKLRDEKVEIEEQIEKFRAEGKSTRMKEALLNMKEQQIRTALLSLEQLRASRPSERLLRYDHTVDRNGKRLPPLLAAFRQNDLDAVKEFLRNGADPNEVDENGWTALMIAASAAKADMVTALMNHPDIKLNLQERWTNSTALHLAVENCHPAIVRQLLSDNRIDTSLKNRSNRTPLMEARYLYNMDKEEDDFRVIIEMLIRFNYERALTTYHDGYLKPPLSAALEAKDEDAVEALLDGGADPNEVDRHGWNALHWAARKDCRLPLFHRILERIKNVNAGNNGGTTALMLAAFSNHLDIVVSLMNHPEIDLNVQNRKKETALHYAVAQGHITIVEKLLSDDKIEPSLILKAENKWTPLELAEVNGWRRIVSLFAKRKAKRGVKHRGPKVQKRCPNGTRRNKKTGKCEPKGALKLKL